MVPMSHKRVGTSSAIANFREDNMSRQGGGAGVMCQNIPKLGMRAATNYIERSGMALVLESALLGVLCVNCYNLNEIRKISQACYAELNSTRWENGRRLSVVAKQQQEGLTPLRGQA
jgi:hypothetical protein